MKDWPVFAMLALIAAFWTLVGIRLERRGSRRRNVDDWEMAAYEKEYFGTFANVN